MAFWEDIFGKSLPEGTPMGNLLRKVSNDLTGGFLGNGAARISQTDYDIKNLTDDEYIAKYGKTKTGVVKTDVNPNPNIYAVDQQLRAGINKKSGVLITAWAMAKRFWFLVFPLVVLLLVWLISLITEGTSRKPYYKRKK